MSSNKLISASKWMLAIFFGAFGGGLAGFLLWVASAQFWSSFKESWMGLPVAILFLSTAIIIGVIHGISIGVVVCRYKSRRAPCEENGRRMCSTHSDLKINTNKMMRNYNAISVLRVFSSIAVVGGVGLICLCHLTKDSAHCFYSIWPVGLLLTLIGVAAFQCWKIGAILLSFVFGFVAIAIPSVCLIINPHITSISTFFIAIVFCLPGWYTFRGWKMLR